MTTQHPPKGLGKGTIIALVVVMILLAAIPLAVVKGASFGGSDDAGSELIAQLAPNYNSGWIHNIWTPPSSETESMLFALQAVAGGILIGYFLGFKRGEKRTKSDNS